MSRINQAERLMSEDESRAVEICCDMPMKNGKRDIAGICRRITSELPGFASTKTDLNKWVRNTFYRHPEWLSAMNVKVAEEYGYVKPKGYSVDANGDSVFDIDIPLDKINDPDWIINQIGADPGLWTIKNLSYRTNSVLANSTTGKTADEEDSSIERSSSRGMKNISVTLVPRRDEIGMQTLMGAVRDMARKSKESSPHVAKFKASNGDCMAVVTIADLHFGKFSWAPETGVNFDSKIAKEVFEYTIDEDIKRLVAMKNIYPLSKIVFFWSQDMFQYDTIDVTTTAGTRQDTDIRWQKMFREGCAMIAKGIERITNELKVPLVSFCVRSNHDEMTSFYANEVIREHFMNNKNVEISDSCRPRFYLRFGCNLLGFGHGDKEKNQISRIMQEEQSEDWGETTNHTFFLGHYHHERVQTEGSLTLRYLPSPTAEDSWHSQSGYVGAKKSSQVFILSKTRGDECILTVTVPHEKYGVKGTPRAMRVD